MRYTAHHKPVLQIVEAIKIFQDQTEFPHQLGILEVTAQSGIGLGDEQRIVRWQGGNETGRDSEIVLLAMAGAASAAVAAKRLVEEDLSTFGNQPLVDAGRPEGDLAERERREQGYAEKDC